MEELLNLNKEIEEEFEVEEITIKMPNGGHLSGKWWGDKSIRPILCLPGWQDNAGTFDRLIPLLPREFAYLAVDLPGHGKSSWLPERVLYHTFSYLHTINFICREYNWSKVSIIGHSLCSRLLFVYSALFPHRVDMAIGFDNLKPLTLETSQTVTSMRYTLDAISIMYERGSSDNPPAYSIEEMIERLLAGTGKSLTRETAPYLLRRNIQPSKKYPGKFNFARDGRLRNSTFGYFPHEVCMQMARNVTMPYLFIKGSGTPEYERSRYTTEVLQELLKSPCFEYWMIESESHHFHLTEPEKIAGIVSKFIRKHRGEAKSHL